MPACMPYQNRKKWASYISYILIFHIQYEIMVLVEHLFPLVIRLRTCTNQEIIFVVYFVWSQVSCPQTSENIHPYLGLQFFQLAKVLTWKSAGQKVTLFCISLYGIFPHAFGFPFAKLGTIGCCYLCLLLNILF